MSFARTLQRSILTKSFPKSTLPSSRMRAFSSYIVTPRELSEALSNPPSQGSRTISVCAAWFLPNDPRTGQKEFLSSRIPGARFFDLDAIKDHDSPYPHMIPTAATFAESMSELGIEREDTVVVYDSASMGIFSAPRAAWTFRVFGHPKVHLLNNFKAWVEEGLSTETGDPQKFSRSNYPVTQPDLSMISGFEEIREIAGKPEVQRKGVQILDARPYGRFLGTAPEPRPGLSSGHVPGSISVPFSELVDPDTKKLRPAQELREILLGKGVDPNADVEKKIMCGTGVTAVVIDAALERAGFEGKRKVYDGSWTEWAQRVDPESELVVKDVEKK